MTGSGTTLGTAGIVAHLPQHDDLAGLDRAAVAAVRAAVKRARSL
jgi:hypothetical protein